MSAADILKQIDAAAAEARKATEREPVTMEKLQANRAAPVAHKVEAMADLALAAEEAAAVAQAEAHTATAQAAVDKVAEAGGGTVVFGSGVHPLTTRPKVGKSRK